MNHRRHLILIIIVGARALAGSAPAAAQGPETQPAQPPKPAFQTIVALTDREIGRVFTAQRPGWTVTDAGYGGAADGNWSYALAGHEGWQDYRIIATLALKKPADRQDGMELGNFAVFSNLADLGGYEAGVIARYQGPQKFYRVAVSSLWK